MPSTTTENEPIPVLRPLLPPVERLLSYLRQIDARRIYTNWGPLGSELEARLSEHVGLPPGSAILASSGTMALVGAALATAGRATPSAPVALVPAFTFVATPLAAEHCGFQPYLVDIHPESWSLHADALDNHEQLSRSGLVVPVAPFGRAVPQAPWVEFQRRTGIPVVIDGGASFEAISDDPARFVGPIPVALSFHATKSFSTAEGGCVLTTDAEVLRRVGEALNFGFDGTRSCNRASVNGKSSEYHAAVGLAELDGWAAKRSALLHVADGYRRAFAQHGLANRLVAAPEVASCYVLFQSTSSGEAETVIQAMSDANIESRLWYGSGLHHHPYFAGRPYDELRVTDGVAPRLLALPVAPDLSAAEIHRVVTAVVDGVTRRD